MVQTTGLPFAVDIYAARDRPFLFSLQLYSIFATSHVYYCYRTVLRKEESCFMLLVDGQCSCMGHHYLPHKYTITI